MLIWNQSNASIQWHPIVWTDFIRNTLFTRILRVSKTHEHGWKDLVETNRPMVTALEQKSKALAKTPKSLSVKAEKIMKLS